MVDAIDATEQRIGGECEIRTHEDLATLPVFKTGAFNRSANSPSTGILPLPVLAPVVPAALNLPKTGKLACASAQAPRAKTGAFNRSANAPRLHGHSDGF
jgi:hypothetical protein